MYWLKQIAVLGLIAVAALAAWIWLDPQAGTRLAALGVPETLVGTVADPTPETTAAVPQPASTPVVTAQAGTAAIHDRVSAIGDGEAVRSVTVYPRSEGVLTEILAKPGDRVRAGDVLARLDLELQTIARDQARLAVQVAEEKVERTERLVQSRAVSEVQLTDARNELQNLRLALRSAEVALERRLVTAPIDGIIGIIPVEEGDFVQSATEIVTIDDRSTIIVDFWVPERFAPLVVIGQTVNAEPIALPGMTFPGKVAAIGSRVDRVSRTLQIQAHIDNSADQIRPGMSFRTELFFEGVHYAAVDPLAIQWSSDGPFVWKNAGDTSERVPVQIVQRNSDYVLVSGDISAGDEVIIEGLQTLRPGSAIHITRRSANPVQEGS